MDVVGPRVYRRVGEAFPGLGRYQNPVKSVKDSGGVYRLLPAASGARTNGVAAGSALPMPVKVFGAVNGGVLQLTGATRWEFPEHEVRIVGDVSTGGHPLSIRALRLVGENARLVGTSMAPSASADGVPGVVGIDAKGAGQSGQDGTDGGNGQAGTDGRGHGNVDIVVDELVGALTIVVSGQAGADGGRGGRGGNGGKGARGVASRPGIVDCASGPGFGGKGGSSGSGGDGGNGGHGGNAGAVLVSARKLLTASLEITAVGGAAGKGGGAGAPGDPGMGGAEGALRGLCRSAGRTGAVGTSGRAGKAGHAGVPGKDGAIIIDAPSVSEKVTGRFSYKRV